MTFMKLPSITKSIFGVLFSFMLLNNVHANDGQWLQKFDLAQYQNKVVYIDFWASWCGPCRKSFPWINAIQEKYKDKGLVVIGINLDKDIEKAKQFLKITPAQFSLSLIHISEPTRPY